MPRFIDVPGLPVHRTEHRFESNNSFTFREPAKRFTLLSITTLLNAVTVGGAYNGEAKGEKRQPITRPNLNHNTNRNPKLIAFQWRN